ncbi:DinB family protein [Neobacillus dielmonensis]|uniref:DinB family protein n=1 Tax=Neobacillus dielmonensis TaxID=1347369 RepID=UPI001F1662DD|nr:DinB family protein [Neobacillus dielmonensis]
MGGQLIEYHLWANQRVFNHLKELPSEICFQEVKSVFPSLYETLFHMYQTDYTWLRTIRGDSFDEVVAGVAQLSKEKSERNLEKLEQNYIELGGQYLEFIKSKELNEQTSIQHPSYGTLTTSYSELFHHVANHGTYHRGNLTAILRQIGYKGIPTDYIFFLYEKNTNS